MMRFIAGLTFEDDGRFSPEISFQMAIEIRSCNKHLSFRLKTILPLADSSRVL